jgi:hypothetical protein
MYKAQHHQAKKKKNSHCQEKQKRKEDCSELKEIKEILTTHLNSEEGKKL